MTDQSKPTKKIDQDSELVHAIQSVEKHLAQCQPCQTCLTTLKRTVDLCRGMEPVAAPKLLSQRLRDLISHR